MGVLVAISRPLASKSWAEIARLGPKPSRYWVLNVPSPLELNTRQALRIVMETEAEAVLKRNQSISVLRSMIPKLLGASPLRV